MSFSLRMSVSGLHVYGEAEVSVGLKLGQSSPHCYNTCILLSLTPIGSFPPNLVGSF